jgi:uncharacterized phage protein gp47/JayE
MKFQTKRQQQLLAEMVASVTARGKLSDVADTSVTKHILAAAARQDEEQYFQMNNLKDLFNLDTATGDDLDERAKEVQPSLLVRIQAEKSYGTLIFSRAGTTGTVNIPIGTKVKTADDVGFTTTTAGTITPTSPEQISGHGVGRDSGAVSAVADEPGAAGNVAANTIIKFSTKPTGVDEVTNPSVFSGGYDKETDDAFRTRIRDYINSLPRSTVIALEFGVLGKSAPGVAGMIRYSKAFEDIVNHGIVTLYIDDGTGAAETTEAVTGENVTEGLAGPPPGTAVGGETTLWLNYGAVKDSIAPVVTSSTRGVLVRDTTYFLNPATGQIDFDPALSAGEGITANYTRYTGLIAEAQKIVDGDENDPENYPGLRAAGVLVQVKSPQVLIQTVAVSVTIKEGYDQDTVRDDVTQVILDYINSLTISGDVIRSELIRRMQGVAGVYDVELTAPASNVVLLDDQLARTTNANITVI